MSSNSGYIPFLVAPQKTGQDLSLDPWLIPQDAYESITDAYQYLGNIVKRSGTLWFDSVPHAIDGAAYYNITNITSTISAEVTTLNPHGLATNDVVRLTDVSGLTFNNTDPNQASINGTRWKITKTGANTFTINNTVAFGGAYTNMPYAGVVSTFPASKSANYLPVMAIAQYSNSSNGKELLVLDSRRASVYDPAQGCLKPIGNTDQFTGSYQNPFWWENFISVTGTNPAKLYFTNNVDNIFYWDGTQASLVAGLTAFTPALGGGITVTACLMIKGIQGRLVLFNTTENSISYPTRVRWCQQGQDPVSAASPSPWNQLNPANGGFFDLNDSQYIITQGQIQGNILIASQVNTLSQPYAAIYQMSFTGDNVIPWQFNKIAQSRNVLSTFGSISLDRELTFVGDNGLIVCDGNAVGRYDQKIPDFAINNINQSTFGGCYGIRFDPLWQTWLSYCDSTIDSPQPYNNSILVYNYMDKAWSTYRFPNLELNDDDPTQGIACLGNWFSEVSDPTFNSYPTQTFDYFQNETFGNISQLNSLVLLGGDYQGNVWTMNSVGSDYAGNQTFGTPYADGIPIEMNLWTRQWFPFAKESSAAQFGYIDFMINSDPATTANVNFYIDNYSTLYLTNPLPCIPFENIVVASITDITNANPALITSPNHGLTTGQLVWIYSVQGMSQINGQSGIATVVTQDTFQLVGVDSSTYSLYTTGGYITLEEQDPNIFWSRMWSGQTGVFHQLNITAEGVNEPFTLHAMILYMKKTGRIYKGAR